MLGSRDTSSGRVWVVDEAISAVKGPDGWAIASPSPDDLKDNFEPILDPTELTALLKEAKASLSV